MGSLTMRNKKQRALFIGNTPELYHGGSKQENTRARKVMAAITGSGLNNGKPAQDDTKPMANTEVNLKYLVQFKLRLSRFQEPELDKHAIVKTPRIASKGVAEVAFTGLVGLSIYHLLKDSYMP